MWPPDLRRALTLSACHDANVRSSSGRYQSLVAAYGEAKRERFLRELAEMEENVHLARAQAQEKLDKYAIQEMVGGPRGSVRGAGLGVGWPRDAWMAHEPAALLARSAPPSRSALTCPCFPGQVEDKLEGHSHSYLERMRRAPEILVRLRSHTVWERMSVKLCFTVQGFPTPVVQW